MRDIGLPRDVADELIAELPERVVQRVMAELTPEFVRLCRSDQVAAATAFWTEGVNRIADEMLEEFHSDVDRWSAPEWYWRAKQ